MLDQDRFCAACGKPATIMAATYQPPPRPLERDMYRKSLGGVCAGLANYLNWDITMVRLGYVLLVLFTGVPLILYFVGWMVIPRNDMGNDMRPVIAAPYVG